MPISRHGRSTVCRGDTISNLQIRRTRSLGGNARQRSGVRIPKGNGVAVLACRTPGLSVAACAMCHVNLRSCLKNLFTLAKGRLRQRPSSRRESLCTLVRADAPWCCSPDLAAFRQGRAGRRRTRPACLRPALRLGRGHTGILKGRRMPVQQKPASGNQQRRHQPKRCPASTPAACPALTPSCPSLPCHRCLLSVLAVRPAHCRDTLPVF